MRISHYSVERLSEAEEARIISNHVAELALSDKAAAERLAHGFLELLLTHFTYRGIDECAHRRGEAKPAALFDVRAGKACFVQHHPARRRLAKGSGHGEVDRGGQ